MEHGNMRAIDTLCTMLDKEEQADEVKVAPVFNICVSDPEDIKKLKKLLK